MGEAREFIALPLRDQGFHKGDGAVTGRNLSVI